MIPPLTRFRNPLFYLLGKEPEGVVVSFLSGPEELAQQMSEKIQELAPMYRHMTVPYEPGSTLALWWKLRRRFRRCRIGLAPVLLTKDARYAPLRRAAFLLAPRKILAFNPRLERHHLRLTDPISSWLFFKGVPLDRIFLRPSWLFPWKKDRTVTPDSFQTWEGKPVTPGRGRIALLTPYFPWPLSHGGAVRIFSLIREMQEEFDVFLLSFIESAPGDEITPILKLCAEVTLVQKPRYREPRWSTILPPEVREFESPAMQRALQRVKEEHDVQIVQVEYTFLASYPGSVLVEHDVTFDLYQQIAKRTQSIAASWDLWRWRRFEKAAIRRFSKVVVMSRKDQDLLDAPNSVVIPNGVDLDRFRPEPERSGNRLLFIGSFRHFPNIVAYRFFFEEVWPEVRRRIPDATATVVSGPTPQLYWREHTGQLDLTPPDGVQLLEFVSDVQPLYVEANLVLVPTLVSAGTNVKVLEALAMERAVLSTTSGAGGLSLRHGVTAWIADGAQAFGEGVITLLENSEFRRRIAEAGRAHAVHSFSWSTIGAAQRHLIGALVGRRAEIRPARRSDLPTLTAIQSTAPEAAQWMPADYLNFDSHIALEEGRLAGFVVSRQIAPGEREILNIAIHPDFRRRGIATALIRGELLRWPGDHFLEVRESNTPARTLYRRLGFREVGVRPDYYDSPPEPGIVMRFFS